MDISSLFIDLNEYKLTDVIIGKGFSGYVKIVVNNDDGKKYAAKIFNFHEDINAKEQGFIMQMALINYSLNHPAIGKLYGINFHSFDDPYSLQPTFIMEYFPNGTLDTILSKERQAAADSGWNDTKKIINLLGIAHAMSYLHKKQIAHRDLKPQNIFLDNQYYPHISSFDISCYCKNNESLSETAGTPIYMAPEIINGEKYGLPVDVYSFSILAHEIVTLNEPFKINGRYPSRFELMDRVMKGERPAFPDDVTKPMRELIEQCWIADPDERPPFGEVFERIAKVYKSYMQYDIDEEEIEAYIEMLRESEQNSE